MSRSRPATTSSRGGGWSRPPGSTSGSSRSGPSGGARSRSGGHRARPLRSASARSAWPGPGSTRSGTTSATASPARSPRASTTPCGKGPRPIGRSTPTGFHYNWHWFWNWGTGELGNNGIHGVDVARWGLGVDAPLAVSSGGGKYVFDDDQEVPDTQIVTWEFPERLPGLGTPHVVEAPDRGLRFRHRLLRRQGDADHRRQGLAGRGRTTRQGKPGPDGQARHVQNFLDCVKVARSPTPTSRSAT